MKDKTRGWLRPVETIVGSIGFAMTVALVIFAAYSFAEFMASPQPKSERQQCEERGGVWVQPRGESRCFAKEAFK